VWRECAHSTSSYHFSINLVHLGFALKALPESTMLQRRSKSGDSLPTIEVEPKNETNFTGSNPP
jgi:hypothetical protein